MNNYNFYRRYRPDTFKNVVGQEVIVKTLSNAIDKNTIAHAYIFNGPRGTGKTSVAKIFSKEINGFNDDLEHADIYEIDAASNNGVDEIRKIIENVNFIPIEGKYKVYIIDEVHMLSKGAFNALLKTLEDPPSYVVFILATTEIHKVPITVLSRCIRFDFQRINVNVIAQQIENILTKENITYQPDAVLKIAQLADGSMRDALSLLEKVITYDQHLTLENVCICFNLVSQGEIEALFNKIINGDIKVLLDYFDKLYLKGIDGKKLIEDLQAYTKDLILKSNNPHYIKLNKMLSMLHQNLYFSNNVKLTIEVYLIDMANLFINNTSNQSENTLVNEVKNIDCVTENTQEVENKKTVNQVINEQSLINEDNQKVIEKQPPLNDNTNKILRIDDNITLMDILLNANKDAKISLINDFQTLIDENQAQKNFGLASFYTHILEQKAYGIKACSDLGCVIGIADNMYQMYQSRFDDITTNIQQQLQKPYHIIYMLNSQWEENVSYYRKRVNAYKENNLTQQINDLFAPIKIERR